MRRLWHLLITHSGSFCILPSYAVCRFFIFPDVYSSFLLFFFSISISVDRSSTSSYHGINFMATHYCSHYCFGQALVSYSFFTFSRCSILHFLALLHFYGHSRLKRSHHLFCTFKDPSQAPYSYISYFRLFQGILIQHLFLFF